MKSKDVQDAFKEIGFEKKNSGASVEAEEFELLLVHLTSTHQIKNLEAYTSGGVSITTVKEKSAPKAEKAPEQVKTAEVKEPPKAEAKIQEKPAAPKGATGQLGQAELAAIQRVLQED